MAQGGTPAAKPAAATSLKGLWVGFVEFGGTERPVKFAFDSAATGWVGATMIAEAGPDSLYLDPIVIKKDSVSFGLGVGGATVMFRGVRTGNVYAGEMTMQGQPGGSVRLARAGTAEAAQLLTPPMDLRDE
jgi:hypothetical protein